VDGDPETYVLPLARAEGKRSQRLMKEWPHAVVARISARGNGVLYDPTGEPAFANELLRVMATRRKLRGERGEVHGSLTKEFRELRQSNGKQLKPQLVRVEQSNTSIMFGNELFFKLFRKLDQGLNPDLEIGRQLVRKGFEHTPDVTGELHYTVAGTSSTLGVMKRYVPNEGDAWSYTLDALGAFFERVLTQRPTTPMLRLDVAALLERARADVPELAHELLGPYVESARLMGVRTAQMHRALAAGSDRREFAPEPFSALYQRSLYQSMRNLSGRIFQTLERRSSTLPDDARALAADVLEQRGEILDRMRAVVGEKMEAQRIRTHGDYHLGQILYTGRDFIVIDFEGEPARPLTERQLKRSPLSDVAGMLRSFSYGAYTGLLDEEVRGMAKADELEELDRWARFWAAWASASFLQAYRQEGAGGELQFLPAREEQFKVLLEAHLFEKAVYELGYELNNRPDWIAVPLRGIRQLLDLPAQV
jgi:maltose alpha-D-glucosyltransferase / alpha-amylase